MVGTFALDLSRIIAKAKGKADIVVRKVMLEAFSGVVMMSPVDSGRFRANWLAQWGAPNRTTSESTDKDGGQTVGRISGVVAGMPPLRDGSMFLTNSLPYSIRLEHGHSRQAPAGMVGVTLARISARYGA